MTLFCFASRIEACESVVFYLDTHTHIMIRKILAITLDDIIIG